MTRTKKYKVGYALAVLSFSIGGLTILYSNREHFLLLFSLFIVLCLIPGRLQGFLWRSFFIGRNLMTQGKYGEAISYFQNFENLLDHEKWLKHAIYLAGFIYTKSIRVMTLNNIGVCYLEFSNLKLARSYFEQTVDQDPEFPLGYYNLAIISEIENNHDLAVKQYNLAFKLGYKLNTIDQMVHKAGQVYAKVEGNKKAQKLDIS